MISITHVVDYLMPTMGYQEFLLPKWNARHGHNVHIVTSDRYFPVPNYEQTWGKFLGPRHCGYGAVEIEGVTVHRLPCSWEWKGRLWMKGLESRLNSLASDVVFCHGSSSPSSFRVARFGHRSKVPVLMDNHMVFSVQNNSAIGRAYYWGLRLSTRRAMLNGVNLFLGVAQECCDFLEREQGVPPAQIQCLPLGVDTDLFHPDEVARDVMRVAHRIPTDATVIMQTGKLLPDKGPHLLAEAMAPILQENPDIWLVFVGAGSAEYEERIWQPLIAAGVAARTQIIPFVPVSQLARIYNMADICVYPEATSLSALEAAACGVAVIMTDLPASQWRANQGIGVCYRTADINDLRATIDRCIQSSDFRLEIGQRGHKAVVSHFSYEAIASQSETLMYEAIEYSRGKKSKTGMVHAPPPIAETAEL